MCNLYSLNKPRDYVVGLAKALRDLVDRKSNQAPLTGVFPDYSAPILRHDDGLAAEKAREIGNRPDTHFTYLADLGTNRGTRPKISAAFSKEISIVLARTIDPELFSFGLPTFIMAIRRPRSRLA